MTPDRLRDLHERARRRFFRRKARCEAMWTRHVQKHGRHPTVWHTPYERALELEDQAYILMNWLGRLAGIPTVVPQPPSVVPVAPPPAPTMTLVVWRSGHYLDVRWQGHDARQQRLILTSFKDTFPTDRAYQDRTQSWCLHHKHLPALRRWANRHFAPEDQTWDL